MFNRQQVSGNSINLFEADNQSAYEARRRRRRKNKGHISAQQQYRQISQLSAQFPFNQTKASEQKNQGIFDQKSSQQSLVSSHSSQPNFFSNLQYPPVQSQPFVQSQKIPQNNLGSGGKANNYNILCNPLGFFYSTIFQNAPIHTHQSMMGSTSKGFMFSPEFLMEMKKKKQAEELEEFKQRIG